MIGLLSTTVVLNTLLLVTRPADAARRFNTVNSDGSYTFGYEGDGGSFRTETRDTQGRITGKYGFIGQNGQLRVIEYGHRNGNFGPQSAGDIPRAVGASGDTGAKGDKGSKGAAGTTGSTGPIGPKGQTGSTGSQGPKGFIGPVGFPGPVGPTGPVGGQGPAGIGYSPTHSCPSTDGSAGFMCVSAHTLEGPRCYCASVDGVPSTSEAQDFCQNNITDTPMQLVSFKSHYDIASLGMASYRRFVEALSADKFWTSATFDSSSSTVVWPDGTPLAVESYCFFRFPSGRQEIYMHLSGDEGCVDDHSDVNYCKVNALCIS